MIGGDPDTLALTQLTLKGCVVDFSTMVIGKKYDIFFKSDYGKSLTENTDDPNSKMNYKIKQATDASRSIIYYYLENQKYVGVNEKTVSFEDGDYKTTYNKTNLNCYYPSASYFGSNIKGGKTRRRRKRVRKSRRIQRRR